MTESFCERCGTRYEFKAPTRLTPLRRTRGLFGGLKNYLTSQDALSDAIGDAMRSEEEQLAAAQLEAFHESFNFCIGCRQYTCLNCWNDDAGRCRSCAPVAGTDDLTDRLAASFSADGGAATEATAAPAGVEASLAEDELQRRLGLEAWPSTDMPVTRGAQADATWPSADAIEGAAVEPEPEVIAAELELAAEAEPEPEPSVVEPAPEPEPVVADPEPRPLRVVAWDEDAPYEVLEPEPIVAEAIAEPEPVAPDVEPGPIVAEAIAEPEPVEAQAEPAPDEVELEPAEDDRIAAAAMVEEVEVAAEIGAEPEPEPVPEPARPIRPITETILRFPAPPTAPVERDAPAPVAAEDDSPEVAARRAQLELLGLGDPGEGPVAPSRPAVLPYRSRGATPTPIELAARAGGSSFWEASAREVAGAAAQVGVQNCGQCGLSLSASARFCRRCGTRQARSA